MRFSRNAGQAAARCMRQISDVQDCGCNPLTVPPQHDLSGQQLHDSAVGAQNSWDMMQPLAVAVAAVLQEDEL